MPKMTLLTVLPSLRTNNLKGLGATLTLDLPRKLVLAEPGGKCDAALDPFPLRTPSRSGANLAIDWTRAEYIAHRDFTPIRTVETTRCCGLRAHLGRRRSRNRKSNRAFSAGADRS